MIISAECEYWAVDFDGTIVKERQGKFIDKAEEFEEIEYGAIQTLIDAQEEGYKIIIWTVRTGEVLDEAIKYLNSKGFAPNAVNRNIMPDITFEVSGKVLAQVYMDNRSFPKFTGWKSVRETFLPKRPLILPKISKRYGR
jgi:hydroxymethylpyrimidine pyrophosphatase-like HAD family hydrolase